MNTTILQSKTLDGDEYLGALQHDLEKCVPCQRIKDEDIFVLNSLVRLRNCGDHVVLWMAYGVAFLAVHRAIAVTLALCNGKRTIADIAKITRPLVKIADEKKAMEIAKRSVKHIVHSAHNFKKALPDFPYSNHESLVLTKEAHEVYYSRFPYVGVEYCASDFLPKDISEIGEGKFTLSRFSVPLDLHWHFTSECSTDCKYCYLKRRKVNLLPKERVLSLIKEATDLGVFSISPLGGDVLLYPHLRDILERISEYKFTPMALSTKSFVSKAMAKMLSDTHIISALQFSIDSADDEVAGYLVGRKRFPQRIISSIENALEQNLRVRVKSVITPYNILTIPRLYRKLKKHGVKYIELSLYLRSAYRHSDDLFVSMDSYAWLEDQVQVLQQEFPMDKIKIASGPPEYDPLPRMRAGWEQWKQSGWCIAGRGRMMICADGKVIPCEEMEEVEANFCGDLSVESLKEVWDGERIRERTYYAPRESFKGTPCYDCAEREGCHYSRGICVKDLSRFQHNIYLPDLRCPKSALSVLRTQ